MFNPFESTQKDTIRIVRNGIKSITYKCHVTPNKITLYDATVDVVDGDLLERDLPNGKMELYEISEANFVQEFEGGGTGALCISC
jgi:hypothetical protein